MPKPTYTPYTLGLDIGIASVGWCLLGEQRIVALGVRAFNQAETAKEGKPLNLERRTARLMRNRLKHRRQRLNDVLKLLVNQGLLPNIEALRPKHPAQGSLWELRREGLDRMLHPEEWARVIYHLCKHRGFHWVSRAEQNIDDTKSEGGRIKTGIAQTKKNMRDKNYRSTAEMLLTEHPRAQRNKAGEYEKALPRSLLAEELQKLFVAQRSFGNPHTSSAFEQLLVGTGDQKTGLLWQQHPTLSGAQLLKMLGTCTFEQTEYRAPKASFTAERHVWLTRLNNLRLVEGGITRTLTPQEHALVLPLPYQQARDFTYKQLQDALVNSGLLTGSFEFAGLPTAKEDKDPKAATLIKLPAWQSLRKTLEKSCPNAWQQLSSAALTGQPQKLDEIAWVLSVYKEDDEAQTQLHALNLPDSIATVEALLNLRFDTFHALSLKALGKIVPHMARGLRYDQACAEAGYDHSQPKAETAKSRTLPSFYAQRDAKNTLVLREDENIPRNPVVLRALNQARKVVNAIVRRYGAPMAVHIELARDLSRPLAERREIEKEQKQYKERNQKDRDFFTEEFGQPPKGGEFEKLQLYREQHSQCLYSGRPIDLNRLLEPGYVEVDHVLPYSRSFDNSKNNKVLVLTAENRNKGNCTPYEYLGGSAQSPEWQQFVARVEGNKNYRLAKRSRLLRADFNPQAAEEFRERNLNDTRYICSFFKNYLERHLQLAEGSTAQRPVALSGQLTAFLRARWGLVKVRSDSDRHHALDAAVIAACSPSMVKRLSDHARRKELAEVRQGFVDVTTGEVLNRDRLQQLEQHFPEPWPHFRHELEARLHQDQPETLKNQLAQLGTYPPQALQEVRPLFVSRAAQRRNKGAAHKETIYGEPQSVRAHGGATQRVALTQLTLKDLDQLIDPERNRTLYMAIRERLEAHGGKADKAFATPLYKPTRDGSQGPVVRSVTLVINTQTGIPVRGGIAANGAMLRVDIFSKGGKFYAIPIYAHQQGQPLPNRAIVAAKSETEWTLIDDTYQWCFSLYPNDLVNIVQKKKTNFGYYAGIDRATGCIDLWAHDRSISVGKDGLIRSIGIKTALTLEKWQVDTLGNISPAPGEPRLELA